MFRRNMMPPSEGWRHTFFRNIGTYLPNYTASYLRR